MIHFLKSLLALNKQLILLDDGVTNEISDFNPTWTQRRPRTLKSEVNPYIYFVDPHLGPNSVARTSPRRMWPETINSHTSYQHFCSISLSMRIMLNPNVECGNAPRTEFR